MPSGAEAMPRQYLSVGFAIASSSSEFIRKYLDLAPVTPLHHQRSPAPTLGPEFRSAIEYMERLLFVKQQTTYGPNIPRNEWFFLS